MQPFFIRPVTTPPSDWIEIDAESAGAAIQDYHFRRYDEPWSHRYPHEVGGKRQDIYFARFEIKGEEQRLVSRIYKSGIWRRGGVKPRTNSGQRLQEIASKIGWTRSLDELLAPNWDLEEEEWK